ncbi:MAG: hypothetical protein ACKO2S_08885, partial [Burkholderiaceae bacterium]
VVQRAIGVDHRKLQQTIRIDVGQQTWHDYPVNKVIMKASVCKAANIREVYQTYSCISLS